MQTDEDTSDGSIPDELARTIQSHLWLANLEISSGCTPTMSTTTLKSLTWNHEETEYKLLPCPGSPCLWTVIPLHPAVDPSVKTSSEDFTRGVVIAYVDDLLLTGWQHHIDSITEALLAKYVMKKSGSLPVGKPDAESSTDGINFLGAESLGMKMAQCGAITP